MDLQDHHYSRVAGTRAPVLIAEIARSNVDIDDLAKVINMMITTMMLPMSVGIMMMMMVIIIGVKNSCSSASSSSPILSSSSWPC